jgi:hypothetical protein
LSQQVTRPPEKKSQTHKLSSESGSQAPLSHRSKIALLICVGLILLTFAGLFVKKSPDLVHPPADPVALTATAVQQNSVPVQRPGDSANPAQLQLSGSHTIVYEQNNALYRVSTPDGIPQSIEAPGYLYNRAVPPLLLAGNQLLYSGKGLWVTDIAQNGHSQQIATIPDDQVVTSLVLSSDGRDVAWSTAPANGQGVIRVYAGPLRSSSLIYQHAASNCPCFRVFSFADTQQSSGQMTLLLSNDQGDHQDSASGLWALPVTPGVSHEPQPLLSGNPPQLPLAHTGSTLLYSTSNGFVPALTDNSAPDDVAALNYANGLAVSTLSDAATSLNSPQIVLPEQRSTPDFAVYHWVMSPGFSPDGQTLAYVLFSTDAQAPFARHNVLYTVHLSSAGTAIHVDKPQLLVTSWARFVELGPWLSNSILTFYADDAFYAIDTQTGAATRLARLTAYGHIVTVTGS